MNEDEKRIFLNERTVDYDKLRNLINSTSLLEQDGQFLLAKFILDLNDRMQKLENNTEAQR